LNAPTSGKVNFYSTDGDLLETLPTIGFVSQRSSLFGSDLIQNIGFARPKEEVDLVRVKNVMSLINLSEFSAGKGRAIRSDGTDVSGGERQRISMARVMYCDPDIVVLDEPTSSLDPVNRVKIYEFLEEMHGKKTVIIVTHEKELIDFSDYVLEIKQGKVSFQGSTTEYKKIR
jgi:ABC-type dipeptide/oligopeptide/nickel transport system ATPase component